jgi:hypothetical protein
MALAALHYNENSNRAQKLDRNGWPCYTVKFPKAKKGQAAVHPSEAAYGK